MIKYEQLKKANDQAIRTDVKGQDYVAVNERVKAFKKVFPAGCIETEYTELDGTCTFTARVLVPAFYLIDDARDPLQMILIGTGTAREKDGSTYINKTSFIENCETSAVGRALGFAGFGIDKAIASSEEVENAQLQDVSRQKVDGLKVRALTARCEKDGVDVDKLLAVCKVKAFDDLTEKAFSNVWQNWDKVVALGGGKA